MCSVLWETFCNLNVVSVWFPCPEFSPQSGFELCGNKGQMRLSWSQCPWNYAMCDCLILTCDLREEGGFVVKAPDLQLWEQSVVLETSLCGHREDLSPLPCMGNGLLYLFRGDGDCLLPCCAQCLKWSYVEQKHFRPCWDCWHWGLFAWLISKASAYDLCCWSCGIASVKIVYIRTNYHSVSSADVHPIDCLWAWLLSLTSASSPHLYLRLVFVAGTWGFMWWWGEPAGLQLPWFSLEYEGEREGEAARPSQQKYISLWCAVWMLQLHCSVPAGLQ